MITKEDLQERAQIIRAWEAACKIEHPSVDEANLRIAIGKKLAQSFNLRELRSSSIAGPIPPGLRPQIPAQKK
jgi:hypothetical protein